MAGRAKKKNETFSDIERRITRNRERIRGYWAIRHFSLSIRVCIRNLISDIRQIENIQGKA